MKSPAATADTVLKSVMEAFKKSKLTALSTLADQREMPVAEWIPTGIPTLDADLGGGIPVGRGVEIFGKESVGKTALSDAIAARHTGNGGLAIALEIERTRDPERIKRLPGCVASRYSIMWPQYAEQAWHYLFKYLDEMIAARRKIKHDSKGKDDIPITLVIWDSVAQTVTRDELERAASIHSDEGKGKSEQPAGTARNFSINIPRLVAKLYAARAAIIFINGESAAFGQGVRAGSTTTPGGKKLKLFASIRVRLAATTYAQGDKKLGLQVFYRVVKNKIAEPFKTGDFRLCYSGRGVSGPVTAFYALKDSKAIVPLTKKKGQPRLYKHPFGGGPLTMKSLINLISDDADVSAKAWAQVMQRRAVKSKQQNDN